MHSLAQMNDHKVKTFLYEAYWIKNLLLVFEKIVFWPFKPDCCFILQLVGKFSFITVHITDNHESYDEIGTAIIGKSAS